MARKSRRRTRRRTRKRRGSGLAEKTQAALARKHRFGDLVKRREKYLNSVKERDAMSREQRLAAFAKGSTGKATRNIFAPKKGGKRKSRRRRSRRRTRRRRRR